MYLEFIKQAQNLHGSIVLEVAPTDCWITLPAIWSDEAKQATLNAATRAGFSKQSMDKIHTIAEPEAAAIATLKEPSAPGTPNAIQVVFHIS